MFAQLTRAALSTTRSLVGYAGSATLKSLLWFCSLCMTAQPWKTTFPPISFSLPHLCPPRMSNLTALRGYDMTAWQDASGTTRIWAPAAVAQSKPNFPFSSDKMHNSQGQSPSPCEDHGTIEGSVKMTMVKSVEGCISCLLCGSKTPCKDLIRDLGKLTLQRAPHHREDPDCYFYLAAKALLQNQGDISHQFWNQDKVPS